MSQDRISKAHQLRQALHNFLKSNRNATVAQLFASSPEVCTETIRKALRVLRADEDIGMEIGRGRVATYWPLTDEIRPEEQKRNKLARAAAESNQDKYAAAHALRAKIHAHMEGIERISGPDLATAIGITNSHASRACNAMCKEGTMVRAGEGKSITYALTGKPLITAEEMRARVYRLRSEPRRESTGAKPIGGPGSTVYQGGRLKSTAQGGQGNVRPAVRIQATAGML
jgi:hypothetical protein